MGSTVHDDRRLVGSGGSAGALRRAGSWVMVLAIGLCVVPARGQTGAVSDTEFLAPVIQRTLETAKTDVEVPWFNPATGHGGSIVVERTFYRDPRTPCRSYVRTLEGTGTTQVINGTGCRTGAGRWALEEDAPVELARPATPGPSETPTGGAADPAGPAPEAVAAAGPTCPDTVLVPMPGTRPPKLAYTLPARAEL